MEKKLFEKADTALDLVNKLRNNYFSTRKDAYQYIITKRKEALFEGMGVGYFTKLICFLAPLFKWLHYGSVVSQIY